ncbi:hypothetical protein NDU88_004751 [Pleurodeles waltl]|uniref:Uncharacterized protein n=1 Tax=Pleurodeles waltl TaxID=8319 RepID=A0AAV7VH51_PLEWA|nr:hypothetical protein NDU88_004751 [Pleurodeles waltl]
MLRQPYSVARAILRSADVRGPRRALWWKQHSHATVVAKALARDASQFGAAATPSYPEQSNGLRWHGVSAYGSSNAVASRGDHSHGRMERRKRTLDGRTIKEKTEHFHVQTLQGKLVGLH